MREEEILTLQSAVELDKIHNEGKLFKALKANHISKEEMIAGIFGIVLKKNAQNETQKLLSKLSSSSGGIVGDYWEKEETLKDRIIRSFLLNKEGNFNMENLKNIGISVGLVVIIIVIIIVVVYVNIKKRIIGFAKNKSEMNRMDVEKILERDENFERLRNDYKEQLEALNNLLEFENLGDEKRAEYEKKKAEVEKILNNYDNSVGEIVGE